MDTDVRSGIDAYRTGSRSKAPDSNTSASERRWELIGLFGALGAYLVVAVGGVLVRAPLGHDEAVYALRSRDLGTGWAAVSGRYWADYRAPGLPMMLSVTNRIVGMHVVTMRLTVVLLGGCVLIGSWIIARYLGLGRGAAVAPFLLAVSAGFIFTSSTVLADVPGAAFGIAAVALYLVDIDRGRLRWSMLVVPLASGWATVSRFGAPIMIGAGLVAAFVVAAPTIWRHRNWVVVAQSACLAVGTAMVVWVLLFTDLLSLSGTGKSPAGANRDLIEGKGLTPGSGFDDLWVVLNPWSTFAVPLWSKAVVVVFLVGLVAGVVSAARPGGRPRAVVFGVVAGLISMVGVTASVGLVVANYLALSLPFWVIAAAAGYLWLGEQCAGVCAGRSALGLVGMVAVLSIAAGLVVKTTLDTRHLHRLHEISFASLRDVSVDTGRQLGSDCLIVTAYTPQVGYYSGCRVVVLRNVDTEETLPPVLAESVRIAAIVLEPPAREDATAVLIVDQGKGQPANDVLLQGEGLSERLSEIGTEGQRITHVWSSRILPCIWDGSC